MRGIACVRVWACKRDDGRTNERTSFLPPHIFVVTITIQFKNKLQYNQSPSDHSPSSLLSRAGRFRSRPSSESRFLRFPPPFFPRPRRFFTHRPSTSSSPSSPSSSPPPPRFVYFGASTTVSRRSSPARSATDAEAEAAAASRSNLAFELAMARSAFPRNRTFGRIFIGDLDADADADASRRTAFATAASSGTELELDFVSSFRAAADGAAPPAHAASFGARLFVESSRASADAMRSCARANPSRGDMV